MTMKPQASFLNTRPKDQADSLNNLLHQMGGLSINLPCIEISAPPNPLLLKERLNNSAQDDYIIFLSANTLNFLGTHWPDCEATLIAIGPGTAAALKKINKTADYIPEDFSSEGLLGLKVLQNPHGKKITIFCGENPRPLLAETLKARGAIVQEVICYRRVKPPFNVHTELSPLKAASIDCIISTSLESLNNLYEMLAEEGRDWLLSRQLLVINQAMLERAKELGFKKIPLLAKNASDATIVECLKDFYCGPLKTGAGLQ